MKNKQIILAKRPSGEVTNDCFETIETGIAPLEENQVLIKNIWISVDPYMRNRMNNVESYISPYEISQVIQGDAVGEVIDSRSERFKKGKLVSGNMGWQQYAVKNETDIVNIPDHIVPPTLYLHILGLTGLTAYFGLLEIGAPKKGETIVISGAAGAVGSVAGQIAKNIGCRVIGIAGSKEKCQYLVNELGFDDAIPYKTLPNVRKALRKACPDGVDVYFDNVGGEISDSVTYLLNDFSRVALCGQISQYNSSRMNTGPRLNSILLIHRVKMQGFIVYDYSRKFTEAREVLYQWLKEGKLSYHENTIEGFKNIPNAFMGLFRGENTGKQLVKV